MSRPLIAIFVGLLLIGCAATNPPATAPRTLIQVRGASHTAFDSAIEMKLPDLPVPVFVNMTAAPILTENDFVNAWVTKDNFGNRAVGLQLSDEAGHRLINYTSQHIEKPLAIFIDSQLHSATTVASALRDQVIITGGRSGLSEEQAQKIISAVRSK